MADRDIDLSTRLSRLAAAVPVAPGQLDPVHRGAVAVRQRVRMGWLTPLAFVVAAALLTTALGIGPFAPGATPDAGPVSATTRSGDFELTIVSPKRTYSPDEPIEIQASLTFLGAGEVAINHAAGAPVPSRGNQTGPDTGGTGGPIGFGLVEPVLGGLHLATGWDLSCGQTTLAPGQPVVVPFAKGGSWSTDDPRATEFGAYVADPVLRLSTGTWHPLAVAEFSIGGCSGRQIKMRVEIEIKIQAKAPAATSAAPVVDVVREGPFELAIESAKSRYAPSEPVDVKASLTYRGPERSVSIAHGDGSPMAFGVIERVEGLFLTPAWRGSCEPSVLERNVPLVRPFARSGSFSGDNPAATDAAGFFADPTLELPAGTWHLYVVADFGLGDCGVDRHLLRADLAIVVGDGPSAASPGPAESDGTIEPPSVAVPTTAPQPMTDASVAANDRVGAYTIELRSEQAVYHASDVVKVAGAFTYSGSETIDVQGFKPLVFSVLEPVYGISLSGLTTDDCNFATLEPGLRIDAPFRKSGGVSGSDPEHDFKLAYLNDPVFRLPPGTWHIVLSGSFWEDTCGGGREIRLSTQIEIVVLPD